MRFDVHGPDTPVLAMGDFNDEPFEPSLVTHDGSTGNGRKSRTPPREAPPAVEPEVATDGDARPLVLLRGPNQLDQFLVNINMAEDLAAARRS